MSCSTPESAAETSYVLICTVILLPSMNSSDPRGCLRLKRNGFGFLEECKDTLIAASVCSDIENGCHMDSIRFGSFHLLIESVSNNKHYSVTTLPVVGTVCSSYCRTASWCWYPGNTCKLIFSINSLGARKCKICLLPHPRNRELTVFICLL